MNMDHEVRSRHRVTLDSDFIHLSEPLENKVTVGSASKGCGQAYMRVHMGGTKHRSRDMVSVAV